MHGFGLFRRLVERIPWGAVLRSPGRLNILEEGCLICAGTAYPHVPKEKPAGKKSSWLNTELWLQLGEEKRMYYPGKDGQAT